MSKLSYNGIMYGKVLAATLDFMVVAILVCNFIRKVMKEEIVTKK
jgi:large-conductance mechanosensitive channel